MYTPEISLKGNFMSIGVAASASMSTDTLHVIARDKELNQSSAVTVSEEQGLIFIDFSEISESESTITEQLLEILKGDEYFNISFKDIKEENIRLLQLYAI